MDRSKLLEKTSAEKSEDARCVTLTAASAVASGRMLSLIIRMINSREQFNLRVLVVDRSFLPSGSVADDSPLPILVTMTRFDVTLSLKKKPRLPRQCRREGNPHSREQGDDS